MKQDRFLTGILIGIGVLVVAALVVFFMRNDTQTYVSEDTPEGVVHNYVVALLEDDYEKAYGYLADLEHKPTYEQFRDSFLTGMVSPTSVALDVGEAQVSGDTASVEVALIYNSSDPFSTSYRDTSQRALLVQENGAWKLTSMPYNFWDYNWYQEPPQ